MRKPCHHPPANRDVPPYEQCPATNPWSRQITWLSFPDDTRGNKRFHISCTAGDLFTQLALHEAHHRAQIMAMLREFGKPLEDLDYNALMFERREALSV